MFTGCVFIVLVAAVSAQTEKTVYGEEGTDVTLEPEAGSVTAPITNIGWKDDGNYAMSWEGQEIDLYRHFKERGDLNTSTGAMTIRKLIRNDSGLYMPEINDKKGSPIRLIVISAVPEPSVLKRCNEETDTCELICDGNTTGAAPVSYTWRSDDQVVPGSSNKNYVIKEDSSGVKSFTCELSNPVSKKISQAFHPSSPPPSEGGGKQLNISMAVTVFIIMLVLVLLVASFHRWKTGMWFFDKASMPWEADFWRRNERPPQPASNTAESNGSAANQQSEEPSEETAMKQPAGY
ncbi:CD48 antigen-like [Cololabis saira]|uniref:CD48 antigen-like n=1 Tax=Cololabis saira TaxID=129043 RepID=UPI002AD3D57E|nr:CD48 antigen-like [Cololabis saira]